MQNCLAIDVAKGKSMVTLVSSSGEVLIDPYEVNHSINDFSNLLNRINNFKLDNVSVIRFILSKSLFSSRFIIPSINNTMDLSDSLYFF